jgi:hypothetical protein
MVQVQQRVLAGALVCLLALPAGAQRFLKDDPLWREPKPVNVDKVNSRKLNEYYDFFSHTFFLDNIADLQREHPEAVPAHGVNTLGEVPDSAWFVNRHSRLRPMSTAELKRGPGNENAPSKDKPWIVLESKTEGITPGFQIRDSKGRRYLLKLDPKTNPELASAADVIGSKLFYALGYHVPENYVVRVQRSQLMLTEESKIEDDTGRERRMTQFDLDKLLAKAPLDREGTYRGMASFFIAGKPIGPFRYHGTRADDPNDLYPHEHRRDLRGLYVFSAWTNHTDTKALNSADFLVNESGVQFVKHYLIDFGAILGSDSFTAKSPRAGHVHLFEMKPAAAQFFSLGLYVPRWMTVDYPDMPSVGRFTATNFKPDRWKNNYPNPAFVNRLPDDTFWAAKKVVAFTDQQLRALVETGEYSDPKAVEYVAGVLAERRDKIGRHFFGQVLPLDEFRIEEGRLQWDDLAAVYGFSRPRDYSVSWAVFENRSGAKTPIPGASGQNVPKNTAQFIAAKISGEDETKAVTVYLRARDRSYEVVGIDRQW